MPPTRARPPGPVDSDSLPGRANFDRQNRHGASTWNRPTFHGFAIEWEPMSPDTVWIIGTTITVGGALAGFMYALVNGVHKSIDGVHKRIDDVRADLNRLHDDHNQLEERMRAAGA